MFDHIVHLHHMQQLWTNFGGTQVRENRLATCFCSADDKVLLLKLLVTKQIFLILVTTLYCTLRSARPATLFATSDTPMPITLRERTPKPAAIIATMTTMMSLPVCTTTTAILYLPTRGLTLLPTFTGPRLSRTRAGGLLTGLGCRMTRWPQMIWSLMALACED